MDILYVLIPLSALLVLAILAVFGWAVYHGQFEDLEGEAERILEADGVFVDGDQPVRQTPDEESRSPPFRT